MKLPNTLWAPHGPITVTPKPEVWSDDRTRLNGCYIPDRREIFIDSSLSGFLQHEILEHEWLHAVMDDAGGDHVLTGPQQEWVCSVVGKALASRAKTWR